jgi:hypothetical protein
MLGLHSSLDRLVRSELFFCVRPSPTSALVTCSRSRRSSDIRIASSSTFEAPGFLCPWIPGMRRRFRDIFTTSRCIRPALFCRSRFDRQVRRRHNAVENALYPYTPSPMCRISNTNLHGLMMRIGAVRFGISNQARALIQNATGSEAKHGRATLFVRISCAWLRRLSDAKARVSTGGARLNWLGNSSLWQASRRQFWERTVGCWRARRLGKRRLITPTLARIEECRRLPRSSPRSRVRRPYLRGRRSACAQPLSGAEWNPRLLPMSRKIFVSAGMRLHSASHSLSQSACLVMRPFVEWSSTLFMTAPLGRTDLHCRSMP